MLKFNIITKAEIVTKIADQTNVEKRVVLEILETFMKTVKSTLSEGENLYFRGFGTFTLKQRVEKKGRDINRNTTVLIPAHNIPFFKPSKGFMTSVKKSNALR